MEVACIGVFESPWRLDAALMELVRATTGHPTLPLGVRVGPSSGHVLLFVVEKVAFLVKEGFLLGVITITIHAES